MVTCYGWMRRAPARKSSWFVAGRLDPAVVRGGGSRPPARWVAAGIRVTARGHEKVHNPNHNISPFKLVELEVCKCELLHGSAPDRQGLEVAEMVPGLVLIQADMY
uniref:Uncharacterized protein n=1 Tax=Oryza nivara TaxID=4536 RepID=A0A0E0G0B6_ORYNI